MQLKISWQTKNKYGLEEMFQNHFDISKPIVGVKISLKLYAARINTKTLKDLPYEPTTILTYDQMNEVCTYCINDLDMTIDLYNKIENRINLRRELSKKYNINLLSKSDAQIAEAIIKSELKIIA